ncbi:hypothetical protein ACOSQ3_003746 [Xanthoceras sorbifolium]
MFSLSFKNLTKFTLHETYLTSNQNCISHHLRLQLSIGCNIGSCNIGSCNIGKCNCLLSIDSFTRPDFNLLIFWNTDLLLVSLVHLIPCPMSFSGLLNDFYLQPLFLEQPPLLSGVTHVWLTIVSLLRKVLPVPLSNLCCPV